jgi:hypothetical protein
VFVNFQQEAHLGIAWLSVTLSHPMGYGRLPPGTYEYGKLMLAFRTPDVIVQNSILSFENQSSPFLRQEENGKFYRCKMCSRIDS